MAATRFGFALAHRDSSPSFLLILTLSSTYLRTPVSIAAANSSYRLRSLRPARLLIRSHGLGNLQCAHLLKLGDIQLALHGSPFPLKPVDCIASKFEGTRSTSCLKQQRLPGNSSDRHSPLEDRWKPCRKAAFIDRPASLTPCLALSVRRLASIARCPPSPPRGPSDEFCSRR